MCSYRICGGKDLSGKIKISGSKNALLPIFAACIICKDIVILENVPPLKDTYSMIEILRQLNKPESLITFVTDRPGHDLRYAIDSTKVEKELGWTRTYNFEDGIKETIDWYVSRQDWIDNIKTGKYKESYKA